MYAKVLVGKHKGKTLYVKAVLNDEYNAILVKVDGMAWEYQEGEYEIVDMYGRQN